MLDVVVVVVVIAVNALLMWCLCLCRYGWMDVWMGCVVAVVVVSFAIVGLLFVFKYSTISLVARMIARHVV